MVRRGRVFRRKRSNGERMALPDGEGGEAEIEVLASAPCCVVMLEVETDDAALGVVEILQFCLRCFEAEFY